MGSYFKHTLRMDGGIFAQFMTVGKVDLNKDY